MTILNPESDHAVPLTAIRTWVAEFIKNNIHTAFPGLILEYNEATKRAKVQPGVKMLMTLDAGGGTPSRAPIFDVPVVWPGGAGLSFLCPLAKGNAVLLVCSERGLTEFKRQFAEGAPDPESLFSPADAIALPTFGGIIVTKAGRGAVIQTEDGAVFLDIHSDGITLAKGNQVVTLTDNGLIADIEGKVVAVSSEEVSIQAPKVTVIGDLEVTGAAQVGAGLDVDGGALRHQGRNVGATHTHAGVQPGGGISGPPK